MDTEEKSGKKLITRNRKARHEYEVLETVEAGLVLRGTEVKSLRSGRASLVDGYAAIENGEMWLQNVNIPEYEMGNVANHAPTRPRKLLLHKHEIARLFGKVQTKGLTLIPLALYFKRGRAKVEIGLCKGKRAYDKRETIRKKDQEQDLRQQMKERY
jgi:SsrA-binding protein